MNKTNLIQLSNKDRDKVMDEISQCQARVLQTMVPTILALGLLAIAQKDSIPGLALGCGFAILFCSGLYVAALSHKIFRNAGFLAIFSDNLLQDDHTINWESVLNRYPGTHREFPIYSETTTAGTIYLALALTYFYVFFAKNPIAVNICTVLLIGVSALIFYTYFRREIHRERWKKVKKEIEEELGNSKTSHTSEERLGKGDDLK